MTTLADGLLQAGTGLAGTHDFQYRITHAQPGIDAAYSRQPSDHGRCSAWISVLPRGQLGLTALAKAIVDKADSGQRCRVGDAPHDLAR